MKCCKETARALASGETGGALDRFMLRLHLMMCRSCGAFAKHLEALSANMRRLTAGKTLNENELHKLENEVIEKLSGR